MGLGAYKVITWVLWKLSVEFGFMGNWVDDIGYVGFRRLVGVVVILGY